MRAVLALFVVTRVALTLAVLVALAVLHPWRCPVCADLSAVPLLNGLARWDGAAYLDIARDGYAGAGRENLAAYFPLYPLLMRIGGTVFGGSDDAYLAAGVLVSNAALAIAAVALARLASARTDGTRAATYLLIFPTTIFLSAVYADALFLALAVTSALAAERGQWRRSGLLAGGASLTRPFGLIALLPLAIWLWRRRPPLTVGALAIAVAPAAYALWVAYLYAVTGDPLAVLHGYTSGFSPRPPLQAFADLADPNVYGFPWFVAAAFVLFLALVVLSWRVVGAAMAAYATAMFVVIAAAGSLTSSIRYELSIYPAFIALAWITRAHGIRFAWLAISGALALLFAAMFALSYWVG